MITINIVGADACDALAKLHGLVAGLGGTINAMERPSDPVPVPEAPKAKPVQTRRKPDVQPNPEPMEAPIHDGEPTAAGNAETPQEVAPSDIADAQAVARANEEAKQKAIQVMKTHYADKDLRAKFKELLAEFKAGSFSEVADGTGLLRRVEETHAAHKGE